MRVFGIDCGSARTGYGAIDSDGRAYRLLGAGAIVTQTSSAFHERLFDVAQGLRARIQEFQPEVIAVEEVFHAVNARSSLRLSHVRGVALLLVAEAGLPLVEYSPLEVKSSVVGYGRAEKQQVRQMVASLLRLSEPVRSFDASDALAIAICHANRAAVPA